MKNLSFFEPQPGVLFNTLHFHPGSGAHVVGIAFLDHVLNSGIHLPEVDFILGGFYFLNLYFVRRPATHFELLVVLVLYLPAMPLTLPLALGAAGVELPVVELVVNLVDGALLLPASQAHQHAGKLCLNAAEGVAHRQVVVGNSMHDADDSKFVMKKAKVLFLFFVRTVRDFNLGNHESDDTLIGTGQDGVVP